MGSRAGKLKAPCVAGARYVLAGAGKKQCFGTMERSHLLRHFFFSAALAVFPRAASDQSGSAPSRGKRPAPIVGIVGGGIGGAACALALQRKGIAYILLERDDSFSTRRAGYGVTLQQGVSALVDLGLRDKAISYDVPSSSHYVFDPTGKILGFFGRSFTGDGVGRGGKNKFNVHIPRQLLRKMMMDQVEPGCVRWGSRVQGIEECDGGERVRILLEGGDQVVADLVVGADGIRSRIRQEVTSEMPRFMGVMVIMGISTMDHPLARDRVFQTNDGSNRLYCMPFQPGVTFWQLSFPAPEELGEQLSSPHALREEALKRCSSWHAPIPEMIAATDDQNVSGHPVYDAFAPPPRPECTEEGGEEPVVRSDGCRRIVLVGDAAHPMAPFKAQGANQALLDAVKLADVIGTAASQREDGNWAGRHELCDALREYEAAMFERSTRKVQASRRALDMLHSAEARDPLTWGVKRGGVTLETIDELEAKGITATSEGGEMDELVRSVVQANDSEGLSYRTGVPKRPKTPPTEPSGPILSG